MTEERREFVTPEKAKDYLLQNKNNRRLDKKKVLDMQRQFRNGGFPEVPEPISFDTDGILMNGQHRLTACVKSDIGFWSRT